MMRRIMPFLNRHRKVNEMPPSDTSAVDPVPNPAQPGATGGPITDAVREAEALVQPAEMLANGIAAQVSPGIEKRLQAIEATLAAWEPTINDLIGVGEAAAREGHSVGSIVTAIGQKLLGILHP